MLRDAVLPSGAVLLLILQPPPPSATRMPLGLAREPSGDVSHVRNIWFSRQRPDGAENMAERGSPVTAPAPAPATSTRTPYITGNGLSDTIHGRPTTSVAIQARTRPAPPEPNVHRVSAAVHNYYGHDLRKRTRPLRTFCAAGLPTPPASAPREDLLLVTSAAGRVAVANTKATERTRTQTAGRRQTLQHSAARLEPSPGMTTEESSEEKPWCGVQGGRDSARRRGRRAAHRMSNACSAKCKGSHPFFGQHPDELFARRDMAGASEVLPSRRAEV
ncbi:hypothetical protein LXA43DRAFT_1068309 [Ganoderma leucocontextum]|nr:hypothetical protein LXA43DRAFT_1068309 [Ganoderma leucocontextum]